MRKLLTGLVIYSKKGEVMDNQEEIDQQQDSAQEHLKEAGENAVDAVKEAGGAVVDQAEEVADKVTGDKDNDM